MTRTFARLVLCLLIAVLPLQGYAAVARVCCMPMPMQMSGQGGAGHCHQPQAQRIASSAPCSEHSDHGGCHASSCAVCAACCTAFLAAPLAQMPSPLLPSFSLASPAATPLLTGPVPAGLERPPCLRTA
jgi:hypothetical protein